MRSRKLPFHYALHLKSAEGWLALGHVEEAFAEWKQLPQAIRLHPAAAPVREQFFRFWRILRAAEV